MINDNAYKLDLLGEHNVSAIFNISDLFPFDYEGGDLRANPFEEGRSDANDHAVPMLNSTMEGIQKGGANSTTTNKGNLDILSYDGGPITQATAKRMKEAVMGLVKSYLINGQLMVNIKVKGQS